MTALLASLGAHVYSVDIIPEFTRAAAARLAAQGIANVTLETGDAARGWDKHAPYDVILLTGSTPLLPESFKASLQPGGRLLAVVGEPPVMQAQLVTSIGGGACSSISLVRNLHSATQERAAARALRILKPGFVDPGEAWRRDATRAGFFALLLAVNGRERRRPARRLQAGAKRRHDLCGRARDVGREPGAHSAGPRRVCCPLASLSASTQHNDRDIRFRDQTVPSSNVPFNSTRVTLSVTQPIFRMQNIVVYEQALTQVEQADAQLALAAQDLILRVAQAYFDVLLAQDNVAFAEAQKTAIGQQLEQAKRNFEVGTATITDTHEAQARYDLTTAQEIAARNDLELRRRALEQVIARAAPPLAPLGPAFTLKAPEPAVMDTWVGLAQQRNLQVRVAQSALTFATQEIARNRGAHYPTLDAFATLSGTGAGLRTQGGIGNDTRSAIVGLQLALPIYQGGATNSRVRESIANEERARQDLENARRTAEFTARQAFLGITNGIAQVRALEAALVSTQSQLASTRLGQEVGVRTQVDVLNAQQQLFSARRDLAQSKYNYVLSLLRLEAAIGELTEDDLVAVNQWLDRSSRRHAIDRHVLARTPALSDPATIVTIRVISPSNIQRHAPRAFTIAQIAASPSPARSHPGARG